MPDKVEDSWGVIDEFHSLEFLQGSKGLFVVLRVVDFECVFEAVVSFVDALEIFDVLC
jgi:hypothetical protein